MTAKTPGKTAKPSKTSGRGPVAKTTPSAPAAASRVSRAAARGGRLRQTEDKRSAILGAALGLFSRYGLHGTSVDEVAASANVSKSNLLYYFANKEDLYVSVLHELLDLWHAPLLAFGVEQDPREAIAGYIRRKLTLSRDRPDASRLFCLEMVQGAPLLRDEMARGMRELVDGKAEVIRAWIKAGRLAPVEPHHLIFALWATTQHYADFAAQVSALTGKTLDDPAFFEQTVANVQRIVLDGIAFNPAASTLDPGVSR